MTGEHKQAINLRLGKDMGMKENRRKAMSAGAVFAGLLIIRFLSQIVNTTPIHEYILNDGLMSLQVGVPWNWSVFIGMIGVSVLYLGCSFLLYRPSIIEHLALFVWFLCLNCWRSVTQAAMEMWEYKYEISFCTERGIQPLYIVVCMIAFSYVGFCVYSYLQDREIYLVRNILAAVLLFFGVIDFWVITYGSRWFLATGIVFLALVLGLRIGLDIQQTRQPKKYVDTHTHYFLKQIVNKQERLLQEARKKGVEKFVSVAITQESNAEQTKLHEQDEDFYFVAGLHPSYSKSKEDLKWIRESLAGTLQERTVAIGETGLDYHREETTEEEKKWQQECFRAQIKLAAEKHLPLVLHIRDKEKETTALEQGLQILQEFRLGKNPGVFHCFHYGKESEVLVKKYMELGFFFGIGGKLSDKKDTAFRKMVREIPLESLVLETDCPYVKPNGMSGKVNSSLAIPMIAKELAQVKRMNLQEIADQTTRNAERVFDWNGKRRRVKKPQKTEK